MSETGILADPDVNEALVDPEAVFGTPEAVVGYSGLTVEEKIEILRRWEYDASEVCVAVEEGMPAGRDDDVLRRILLSLDALGAEVDLERVGPTKQHGMPRSGVKPR